MSAPVLSSVLSIARRSVLAVAALAAFGAHATDPIRIGVPVGLSGANSVVAPSVVQSAELAVEEINAKGGVLGRKLEPGLRRLEHEVPQGPEWIDAAGRKEDERGVVAPGQLEAVESSDQVRLEQVGDLAVGAGKDGLLFPAAGDPADHMRPATLYKVFYPARDKAGRHDLRFHDLRHTGAVLAASTGATLAELMVRLGHSTPGAAMRYQHAAKGRDAQIAAALSDLAGAGATP